MIVRAAIVFLSGVAAEGAFVWLALRDVPVVWLLPLLAYVYAASAWLATRQVQ